MGRDSQGSQHRECVLKNEWEGGCLAGSLVERATLDFGVVSFSAMLGVEIT